MNKNIKILIIILMSSIIFLFLLKKYNIKIDNLTYEKTPDKKKHLVANLPNRKESAMLLSEIKRRLIFLVEYCIKRYPENKGIKLLKSRFKVDNVQETSISDTGTSYTIDKGSELHLCLRNKKNLELHNVNILMFVAIHELAHIMSTSYGHNYEFTQNFIFLLKKAKECRVYYPEDYRKNEKNFCGIKINSNPLF